MESGALVCTHRMVELLFNKGKQNGGKLTGCSWQSDSQPHVCEKSICAEKPWKQLLSKLGNWGRAATGGRHGTGMNTALRAPSSSSQHLQDCCQSQNMMQCSSRFPSLQAVVFNWGIYIEKRKVCCTKMLTYIHQPVQRSVWGDHRLFIESPAGSSSKRVAEVIKCLPSFATWLGW